MEHYRTDKPPPPINLALVDVHSLLREALATWLLQQGCFSLAWNGADVRALDKALDDGLEVGLVLLGLGKGEEADFAALRWFAEERPGQALAAYVHRHDDASVLRAYRTGARAVLLDGLDGQAVVGALLSAAAGGVFHSQVSQRLLQDNPCGLTERERMLEKRWKEMSPRERAVLELALKYPNHTAARLGKLLAITA